jgi:hypothetical protein
MPVILEPERIFARDFEWRHLAGFADGAGRRPRLGVVSGRRRRRGGRAACQVFPAG